MRAYPQVEEATIDAADPAWAVSFKDHYFSRKDPVGERETVFLHAQNLRSRFQALQVGETFRIGETGFGTGLTFLLATQLFLAEAPPNARLQWISTDQYPLNRADLVKLHQQIELPATAARLATQLHAVWPLCVSGCHRRLFAAGRVCLDLHWDDAASRFANLNGHINAWCLDGFSPDRNPAMWTPHLFQAVAKLSGPDTTLATFTTARSVRDGLHACGFELQKHPGFGGKRERLTGFYRGLFAHPKSLPPIASKSPEHVSIIGAGLSGAWVAHKLAERGIRCTVFDRSGIADGASGNTQGITYAKLGIEATPASVIQLQALASTQTLFDALAQDSQWHPTGVLLLASDHTKETQQAKLMQALNPPDALMQMLSKDAVSDIAGQRLVSGGLWLPTGGWLNPKAACRVLLQHPLISVETAHALTAITDLDEGYRLRFDVNGTHPTEHTCDAVVLANALEASEFAAIPLPLKPVKGQITQLRSDCGVAVPVCGDAYLGPAVEGVATCGATYHPKLNETTVHPDDDRLNLNQTNALFDRPLFNPANVVGHRAGVRSTTPDYAPVAGQIGSTEHWQAFLNSLRTDARSEPEETLPYRPGLFILTGQGSRGTLTAPVTADLIVSQLLGEILPLTEPVREGLAPDRFIRRQSMRMTN